MTAIQVFVESVGLIGPGLSGWAASRAVLCGMQPYQPGEVALPRLDVLPAAERRRTGMPVKLALASGLEAVAGSRRDASTLATVFTSSGGDGQVLHELCETLAGVERQVSPTRFHNSVHNAPAGYWSIATQSRAPSTSLCGFDWSFGIGLLEATVQVAVDRDPVLLLSFDLPYPEPMNRVRPVHGMLGVALLLSASPLGSAIARVDVRLMDSAGETVMPQSGLEQLRAGNPTGRALPLLAALAGSATASVRLPYVAGRCLEVEVLR